MMVESVVSVRGVVRLAGERVGVVHARKALGLIRGGRSRNSVRNACRSNSLALASVWTALKIA